MHKALVALVVVLALAGVACSKKGGSAAVVCTASNATDLTAQNPFTVTMQNFAYQPNCFIAKSSQNITIINKDTADHTFTIDGTQVDVTMHPGQTFNGESAGLAPGTYPFRCKLHQAMTGTVIVQ